MSRVQLEEAILANVADHTRLLAEIDKLEYIPSAMKHETSHIKDLEWQLAAIEKEIPQLLEQTGKKRKEHETLRASNVRKFACKCLGTTEKYEARVNEAEREYIEAFQKQVITQNNQPTIEELLKESRNKLRNLSGKEQQLLSLKAELSVVYARVFDGPTESFPEDDRLEDALHAAEKPHNEIQAKFNSESRAADLLATAVGCMDRCQSSMQAALKYSTKIHYGSDISGSLHRSVAESKLEYALKSAQGDASQIDQFISKAIRASPLVKPVTQVHIPLYEDRIDQLNTEVIRCNQELKTELSNARLRVEAVGKKLEEASRTLDRCRQELHEFRKATFENYINYAKASSPS